MTLGPAEARLCWFDALTGLVNRRDAARRSNVRMVGPVRAGALRRMKAALAASEITLRVETTQQSPHRAERSGLIAQLAEGNAHFRAVSLPLLPSSKVTALREPVVADEVGIGSLGPTAGAV
jgi:hypothetical protein